MRKLSLFSAAVRPYWTGHGDEHSALTSFRHQIQDLRRVMKYLEEDVQAETQALDDAIRTVENLNDGIARAEKVRAWLSNCQGQYFRWLFFLCREAERQKFKQQRKMHME
jgi:chromosome segregation ATPase